MSSKAEDNAAALTVPIRLRRDRLGAAIRKLRENAGLSLRALESKSGVPNSEISKIEAGSQDCRLYSFIRIASALGVPAGATIDMILTVDALLYEPAIQADPTFGDMVRPLKTTASTASFLSAVLAAFAAQLAISSKPTLVVIDIAYPNAEIRDAFVRFAEAVENGMKVEDRMALLVKLKGSPLQTLKELGLLTADLFKRFHDSVEAGTSTNPSYWNQLTQFHDKLTQSPHSPNLRTGGEGFQENMLTYSAIESKSLDVKPKDLWPALKKQLQHATAETAGAKTALAAFLEVELSRVSQWLSDSPKTAREPGAEYALLMQAWLKNPKRQAK